ncbi:PREDICTED: endogenous retrovirus group K member 9 Gag polyprotein-like [Chaetura pelagica]|uniref:endogenous retrovirus group K member 9 Gag polyprotein-like n=1 Tax=Chaetura pelagica TaxID=8897 RepID=UPI00052371B6|nr:PREDICTED: endogenous retrovirus group K member 9 Gag polyprotein-like [Chaetura pelagica]
MGDALWLLVSDKDKTAKKMSCHCRAIMNCLHQYQAEKDIAALAALHLEGKTNNTGTSPSLDAGKITLGGDNLPQAPVFTYVPVPPRGGVVPSAPSPQVAAPPLAPPRSGDNEEGLPACPAAELEEEAARYHSNNNGMSGKGSPQPHLPVKGRIDWLSVMGEALQAGDWEVVALLQERQEESQMLKTFPVPYVPDGQGNQVAHIIPLDWNLLMLLRKTVNESGLHGEPTKLVLNYIWGSGLLLQEDIKNIFKMIMTPSQSFLWQAHWQAVCQESVYVQRVQGDPLYGVILEQLMGVGQFSTPERQAMLGADVIKEAMRLARLALSRVRTDRPNQPSYMSIKQGLQESFSSFVDKITAAIDRAGVPPYVHRALLKECLIQNCNPRTKDILVTLPANAGVEEMLERMSRVPSGTQARLVEAIKDLTLALKDGQALALLRPRGRPTTKQSPNTVCYRCGQQGHIRKQCRVQVWCENCKLNSHSTMACRRKPGNGKRSARGRGARTPTANRS